MIRRLMYELADDAGFRRGLGPLSPLTIPLEDRE